jgi:hypothetical protein
MLRNISWFVLVGMLAAGCGPRKPKSVEIDPALAGLVSSEAVALSGVNLRALRTTPHYRQWVVPALARLSGSSRVDLEADATELLAFSDGKGTAIYAKGSRSVTRLDPGQAAKPAGAGIPPALAAKVQTIAPRHQIWAAGIGGSGALGAALPLRGNLSNLRGLSDGLESWTAGIDMSSGLKIEISLVYRTEADATRVANGVNGLLSIGRMSVSKDRPDLMKAYDSVKLTRQKLSIEVVADVPVDAASRLLKSFEPVQR